MTMQEKIIANIYEKKLIAIVRGIDSSVCLELGKALYLGGINMMEFTFNQKKPEDFNSTVHSISLLKNQSEFDILVGAGTVLTCEQVELARNAGAEYIVTPSLDPDVVKHAKELGMVVIAGAMTPTEIVNAYKIGADFVKIFPASVLGPSYIHSIRAPLGHIPLLAVGGINEKNISDYLKEGVVGAGIGGNLINYKWIESGSFDKIVALAKEYVNAVNI